MRECDLREQRCARPDDHPFQRKLTRSFVAILFSALSLAAVFPLQLLGYDVDSINTVHYSNHSGTTPGRSSVMAKFAEPCAETLRS